MATRGSFTDVVITHRAGGGRQPRDPARGLAGAENRSRQWFPKLGNLGRHHHALRCSRRPCAASTRTVERAVSAIGGVDHVESTSRAGMSTVTVHLKLNHDTAALAEATARLQQVRSELPGEPSPRRWRCSGPTAPTAFYLSFNSKERTSTRSPTSSGTCSRSSPPSRACSAVTSTEGGRQLAAHLDRPRQAGRAQPLPGDVQAALQRNNYLAAVGQTKNRRCRSTCWPTPTSAPWRSSKPHRGRPGRRHRAPARRGGGAGGGGGRPRRQVQRGGGRLPGRVAAGGRQRDRRAAPPGGGDGAHPAHLPKDLEMTLVWDGTVFMRDARRSGERADRDHAHRGPGRLPLHGLRAHGAGAAGGHAHLPGGRRRPPCTPSASATEPADDPGHRALGGPGGGRRHRGGGERGAPRARGRSTGGGAHRSPRAGGPRHRHDHHLVAVYAPIGFQGGSRARSSWSSPSRWPPRCSCRGSWPSRCRR